MSDQQMTEYKSARAEIMAKDGCDDYRQAFVTNHDPATVLRDGMTRHRKVLGSLGVEWIKVDYAEFAVDQLIAMYREAKRDQLNAVAEIERVGQALDREQRHVSHLKKLTDEYRLKLDELALEGLSLKRTGRSLKRKLRSLERSRRRK